MEAEGSKKKKAVPRASARGASEGSVIHNRAISSLTGGLVSREERGAEERKIAKTKTRAGGKQKQ